MVSIQCQTVIIKDPRESPDDSPYGFLVPSSLTNVIKAVSRCSLVSLRDATSTGVLAFCDLFHVKLVIDNELQLG